MGSDNGKRTAHESTRVLSARRPQTSEKALVAGTADVCRRSGGGRARFLLWAGLGWLGLERLYRIYTEVVMLEGILAIGVGMLGGIYAIYWQEQRRGVGLARVRRVCLGEDGRHASAVGARAAHKT